jgi:hypothetical protein
MPKQKQLPSLEALGRIAKTVKSRMAVKVIAVKRIVANLIRRCVQLLLVWQLRDVW